MGIKGDMGTIGHHHFVNKPQIIGSYKNQSIRKGYSWLNLLFISSHTSSSIFFGGEKKTCILSIEKPYYQHNAGSYSEILKGTNPRCKEVKSVIGTPLLDSKINNGKASRMIQYNSFFYLV